MFLLTYLL